MYLSFFLLNRNKPIFFHALPKDRKNQNQKRSCFSLFRFEPKKNRAFWGHPRCEPYGTITRTEDRGSSGDPKIMTAERFYHRKAKDLLMIFLANKNVNCEVGSQRINRAGTGYHLLEREANEFMHPPYSLQRSNDKIERFCIRFTKAGKTHVTICRLWVVVPAAVRQMAVQDSTMVFTISLHIVHFSREV